MHTNQVKCLNKYNNLVGSKINNLTILGIDNKTKSGQYYLKCKCDCGNIKSFRSSRLLNNQIKTCGCLNKGYKYGDKHNLSRKYSKIYSIWNTMKHRCLNPNFSKYKNYGHRGISICDEWKDNFPNFLNWSLNNGYQENLTLDRVDVNGNYEPSNCRWVSQKDQQRNRTNTIYVFFKEQSKPLIQWCEELNLPYTTMKSRINVLKWDVEKAFTTPIKQYK